MLSLLSLLPSPQADLHHLLLPNNTLLVSLLLLASISLIPV
jgi:hypothetical protein